MEKLSKPQQRARPLSHSAPLWETLFPLWKHCLQALESAYFWHIKLNNISVVSLPETVYTYIHTIYTIFILIQEMRYLNMFCISAYIYIYIFHLGLRRLSNNPFFSVSVIEICMPFWNVFESWFNSPRTPLKTLKKQEFLAFFFFNPCQKYWDSIIFESGFSPGQNWKHVLKKDWGGGGWGQG